VVIVVGLMIRSDHLGLTAIVRTLNLNPKLYPHMLHFFNSSAWKLETITKKWVRLVSKNAPLFEYGGRILLIGDGVKESKEARMMPGVKRLHQESDNSSKAEYIFGHMYGSIGVVVGRLKKQFCLPLITNLQDGVKEAFSWSDSEPNRLTSHIVQTVYYAHQGMRDLGKSAFLLLDRYFLSVPALLELKRLNVAYNEDLQIVTKAKMNCKAYHEPPAPTGKRGRPRKKGDPVKLKELFVSQSDQFETQTVSLYGETKEIKYLCVDLLWGQTLYQKLRFVLVEMGGAQSILVTTDLNAKAKQIIELYGFRFKIECTFREFKQVIGGFGYRFWSKSMTKLNRYRKKSEATELEQIDDEDKQLAILSKIEAIEMFVLCSNISLGLLQLLSLSFEGRLDVRKFRFLRTYSNSVASEATMVTYLRNMICSAFAKSTRFHIIRIIQDKQIHAFDEYYHSFDDVA
jgi:hypothetical protein